MEEVCDRLEAGAAALLLAEEAVEVDREHRLDIWLQDQPPWSDLPVLVLARPGADSAAVARAMDRLGNVTVLERPVRVAALVSAVRTALRARERQYQTRAHLSRLEENERELRDTHRRKDEFLAMLAHELRNPLAPIRNSLHILRLTGQHDAAVEAGRRDDGAPGQPHGAAGGRPAGGLAHHRRQDRAAQGDGGRSRRSSRARVETSQPLIEERGPSGSS